jgi:hypothetical protein
VYLLAFRSSTPSLSLFTLDASSSTLLAEPGISVGQDTTFPGVDNDVAAGSQAAGDGRPAVRIAFLNVGDVEAFIVMTNPEAVVPATFTQVVAVQNELLQG